MNELYIEHILEHAKQPHNYGTPDKYDLKEEGVNPSCGDEITLYLTFDKDNILCDTSFTGDGCAICIAATSMMTDKIKSLSRTDIAALIEKDVYDLLRIDISIGREKCALLALRTIKTAVNKTV